ncbi:MAG: hypothetical protein JRI41_10555 [Deltaproteobacteria bacterium]|nr:hypothetical protein [Deltaproteobacteria bacterium]
MGLSKEAIKEFKKIYYKEFGEKLSDQGAQELGANLLSLFKVMCRPISEGNDESDKDPEQV